MIYLVNFFFDMKLYFSDEDGDFITFSSQEELNEAMVNGTEELTVYIQGKYLLQITYRYYKIIKPCTFKHYFYRNLNLLV